MGQPPSRGCPFLLEDMVVRCRAILVRSLEELKFHVVEIGYSIGLRPEPNSSGGEGTVAHTKKYGIVRKDPNFASLMGDLQLMPAG